ncbi:uncharacterized protein LOC143256816 isoform X3 [Tachypleus tridentatus]|uniref:uncharacterized protein LOC143256816 isoform X3 n=1 Tax=Tachypleus tridentatus TaxID=6853 RepID=UPI003FD0DCFF
MMSCLPNITQLALTWCMCTPFVISNNIKLTQFWLCFSGLKTQLTSMKLYLERKKRMLLYLKIAEKATRGHSELSNGYSHVLYKTKCIEGTVSKNGER